MLWEPLRLKRRRLGVLSMAGRAAKASIIVWFASVIRGELQMLMAWLSERAA